MIGSSVIQTSFVGGKPVASSIGSTDNLLLLTAGGTYAQVPFSTLTSSISTSNSQIWSVRLNSFNSVGNPNFECDQTLGTAVSTGWGPNGTWRVTDRWYWSINGTAVYSMQLISGNVPVPTTNYYITRQCLRITLTTAQASLAAGNYAYLFQSLEGPVLRELLGDVNSVSLLVRSSVANLKFGLALQDSTASRSLTKLCSLGAANTWTLISLSNLPVWPAAGVLPVTPGSLGYYLEITLAAGTTFTSPANDTWQTGNFFGAVGQSNFSASPVNSTFDIAFIQHEPGAVCSTLMDCPFGQNLDGPMGCLRYFCKSWPYAVAVGSTGYSPAIPFTAATSTQAFGSCLWPKRMAKAPTVTFYSPSNGAVNSAYAANNSTVLGGITASGPTETAANFMAGSSFTLGYILLSNYTADTGW